MRRQRGFQQALTDKLGKDGVEFDLQNAQNEAAELRYDQPGIRLF